MKRILSAALIFCLLLAALSSPVIAGNDVSGTRASAYLARYRVTLSQGDAPGELQLSFNVTAGRTEITKIGVSQIRVYSGGQRVLTVNGSIANGLLAANRFTHAGDYTLHLTPGVSYYAVVTVMAMDNAGSDSRNVTTSTVTAPS